MNRLMPLTGLYPLLQKGGRGDSRCAGAAVPCRNPPQSPFRKGGGAPHNLLAFSA